MTMLSGKQALEKERSEVLQQLLQQLEDWLETPILMFGFV
ncbi:potassium channel protein [Trichormus variabilis ATCC 29413]|uniref:Potassium channel protein n=1 Tax=Trichormus variabilis (strain ATCC 29413 / PCC 7937) TaxID=240292 RepID=Q3MES1_TRIV2|nr:potassium channel protein [Trichormus variabilis ATCC 29413]